MGHALDCCVLYGRRLARCDFRFEPVGYTSQQKILYLYIYILLSLGTLDNSVLLLTFGRFLCPRRLIARKDEVDALVTGEGAAGGSGKMRHRYILEPVDASARVALSVDPMDR